MLILFFMSCIPSLSFDSVAPRFMIFSTFLCLYHHLDPAFLLTIILSIWILQYLFCPTPGYFAVSVVCSFNGATSFAKSKTLEVGVKWGCIPLSPFPVVYLSIKPIAKRQRTLKYCILVFRQYWYQTIHLHCLGQWLGIWRLCRTIVSSVSISVAVDTFWGYIP